MMKSGDCVVKHPGSHATGLGMVVSNLLLRVWCVIYTCNKNNIHMHVCHVLIS